MKYARYRDDLAFRIADQKFIQPDNHPTEWAEYQAWLAVPNTPVDGNLGHPGLGAKQSLGLTDYRMARIGEDVMNALISKGVLALTDLPPVAQQLIQERQTLRGRIASE